MPIDVPGLTTDLTAIFGDNSGGKTAADAASDVATAIDDNHTDGGGGGPADQLDADGTTLDVDAIGDDQYLKRVGTSVVGRTEAQVLSDIGGASAADLATESATRGSADTALAAPDYLVKTATATLPAERVVTDSVSVVADWATAGQAIFRSGIPRAEIVTTTIWYAVPQQGGCATLTTTATTDDIMRAVPFVAPRSGTIDLVAVEITSGSGAGEEHIVAIYADDGTRYPGALIDDSGSIDGSSAGIKTASVSAAVKAGEMYWMVLYSEFAATFRAIGTGNLFPLLGYETTLGITGPVVRYSTTRAWDGTAPATFPGGATIGTSNAISALAAVWYRWGA